MNETSPAQGNSATQITDRPTPETDAAVKTLHQKLNDGIIDCQELEDILADHARLREQQRDAAVEACESVTNQDAEHLARDMDHRCKDHSRWYANVEKARATLAAIKETK